MVNNSRHTKLDDVIKHTLSNYEIPYSISDWERMESLLNTVPKSSSLNYKDTWLSISDSLKTMMPKSISIKRIRPTYTVIGLSLVIGVFLICTIVHFYKKSTNTTITTTQPTIENTAKPTVSSDSSIHTTSIVPAANPQQLVDTIENIIPEEISDDNSSDTDDVTPDQKENIAKEQADMNEETNSNNEKEEQPLKKNNTPVSTNIHDSLKVSNAELKENKKQNDNIIHADTIIKKNAIDSSSHLLHNPNPLPKDTLKTPN